MKEELNPDRSPPAASSPMLEEEVHILMSLLAESLSRERRVVNGQTPAQAKRQELEDWLKAEFKIYTGIVSRLSRLPVLNEVGRKLDINSEEILEQLKEAIQGLLKDKNSNITEWLSKGLGALAHLICSKNLKDEFIKSIPERVHDLLIRENEVINFLKNLTEGQKRVEAAGQKLYEQGQKLKEEVTKLNTTAEEAVKKAEEAGKKADKAIELRDALSSGLDCIRGVINRILKLLKVKTESIEKIINKLGRSFSNLKYLKKAVNASLARIGVRIKTFKVNKEQLIALLKDERFRGLVAAVINVYEIGKRHMMSLEGIRKEDGKYIITIGQTNVPKKDERAGAIEMEIDNFFSKYSKEGEIVLVAFIVEDAGKLKAVVDDPAAVEEIKRRSNTLEEYIKENGIRETTKEEDESEEGGVIEGVQGGQGGQGEGGGATGDVGQGMGDDERPTSWRRRRCFQRIRRPRRSRLWYTVQYNT